MTYNMFYPKSLNVIELRGWTAGDHMSLNHYQTVFYLLSLAFSTFPKWYRPITVLLVPYPYRVYASLRCQTLVHWQNSWIHSSQFAFCKGCSTTSMNSHLALDLSYRCSGGSSFAGFQCDFAKCFDSIPYTVLWDVLLYHGCDPSFVCLVQNLYLNMQRRFRCAGCLGSTWYTTNGLLQGDPRSVVILNCVLRSVGDGV